MLPPRGRKIFAKPLAQSYLVLSDKLVCFNQKLYGLVAKWFPGVLPLHGTSARSPLAVPQGEVPEERGRSGTSLSSRAGSAVPRDIFCSAPPLGCGIHSRLGRQTANNGTSWRLICASRARSRAGARLGRASRACSPPICTILRRLIKLVCALLRFRERPRTIEVQRTTSSPQNHRKSLAQYSVVLFI